MPLERSCPYNAPVATSSAAAGPGSKAALATLVALVVASPWPFGSAHLRATQAIALVSLATALGAFAWDGWHRRLLLPPRVILWPLAGLWALAVSQLVPLPEALHRVLAPGTAVVWHPDVPAAAAVLGPGPHPVSLHPEATRRWLAFATGLIGLALAAAPALRERRLLLRACVTLVSGAVLVALFGIVGRLAFGSKLYGVWSVPTTAPFGPFVSKNHFAGYVELAALLAVGLATGLADEQRRGSAALSWIGGRRAKWVVVAWGAAGVLLLAVPVSLSRGGVVSLAAGLGCFILLRAWTLKGSGLSVRGLLSVVAGLGIAGSLLVTVLPTEARDRVLTLAGITTDQSGSYRLALWRDTLRLAASSPLVGSGFGAYEDALPRFKTTAGAFRVQHAENDHLEILAEGGLLGGLLGIIAVLALFVHGLNALRATDHRLARALLAAALAAGVAAWVHAAVDFNLRIPSNALMAVLVVGLCVSAVCPAAVPGTGTVRGLPQLVLMASLLVAVRTPWSEPRWRPATLTRAAAATASSLRQSALDADVAGLLRRRPAQATTWVQLAWLRLRTSGPEAAALARWGAALDPRHAELARVSAALSKAAGGRSTERSGTPTAAR
jgi:O-antigen ligase